MNNFEFFGPAFPKKDLGFETEENNVGINIVETLCVPIFSLAQIFPKMDLGLEIQKTSVGIKN